MKKIILPGAILLLSLAAFCQNPQLLKDVYPGSTGSGILEIVKSSNYTFFNAEDDDADADRGLYRTDGTAAGTIKLNLTYPTYLSTKAEKLTALGSKIIFAGDNLNFYGELWVSDGTQAGTIALERFQPTTYSTRPNRRIVMDIARLNTDALYGVKATDNHLQLKKTDGTPGGITILKDFGIFSSVEASLALFRVIDGILYFNVYDGNLTDQLWRSDGTTAGTYLVKDYGSDKFVAGSYMPAGSFFYTMLVMPGTGNVLWKSDGTVAGTSAVKTIGTSGNNNYPPHAAVGSTLYFAGLDGNGMELWKTDGTAAGTMMVADINPGAAGSNPTSLIALNGNIYFAASDATGSKLWKYDGFALSILKDGISVPFSGSGNSTFAVSENTILFNGSTAGGGAELWLTDGTAANTRQVADINPGAAGSTPGSITPGNPVFFSANNGTNGVEIFKYDNADGINGLHKIYVNDNSTSGDVFTTIAGSNTNPGTRTAPVATINYALSIARPGDTIYLDAGTYAEQVLIDTGMTILGAGAGITTIKRPASDLVFAPGQTRRGVINTKAGIGNVILRNLRIESAATPTSTSGGFCFVSQTGSELSNCDLQGGFQGEGAFFTNGGADPINISVQNNNFRNIFFFGVNIQGANISATVNNNSIDVTGSPYGMGILGGGEPTSLVAFSASGNLIKGFNGFGIKYACTNPGTQINNNYFEHATSGGPAFFINNLGGPQADASCNWYGTTDPELIKTKISGNVNYGPWLISGADTNPAANGFQPGAGTCTGRQNKFYVNDAYTPGIDVYTNATGSDANNGFSTAPFATINKAMSVAVAGDTIIIDAGIYAERIIVTKALYFKGAYNGMNPGSALSRGLSESVLLPSAENNLLEIVTIQVADVTFDGFTFNGDNPSIAGSIGLNGVDVNAGMGITGAAAANRNLQVKNNIFRNFYRYAILLQGNTVTPGNGNVVTRNRIDNIPSRTGREGRAIGFFNNLYGSVTENNLTRVYIGVWIVNINTGSTEKLEVNSNTIQPYGQGILFPNNVNLTSEVNINNNQISAPDFASWTAPGSSTVNSATGMLLLTRGSEKLNLVNNTVSGMQNGIWFTGPATPQGISLTGGSINNCSGVGVFYTGDAGNNAKLKIDGVDITNNNVGIDASYSTGSPLNLEFNNTTIAGGVTGLRLYGNQVAVPGNLLSGISFTGQSAQYILLTAGAFTGQTIDATNVSFEGLTGANMTLAQRLATEDKIVHKVDNEPFGFIRIKSGEVYLTQNSFYNVPPFGSTTTTPSVQRAVNSAAAGDLVHIGAGTFTGQVNIDKGLSLKGAGSAQTIVERGVAGTLVPALSNDAGIIQSLSAIGDVFIDDLTVSGSNGNSSYLGPTHGIILQTGGGIRNCVIKDMKLLTTGSPEGNGLYINYPGMPQRNIDITGNNLSGFTWVGMNVHGANLSATIANNSIDATGANYGMALAAGAWGSTLTSLNIHNNDIRGFNGFGITTGTENTTINNNSLAGIGNVPAVISTSNAITATCNWFGTASAQSIASRLQGNVNYTPWLINGTDADAAIGFQTMPNSCLGKTAFYVNDNSRSGDVFTAGIGSDDNDGSAAAPFATITYAYSIAQPGDSIFVDAGTYNLVNGTYSFPKAMTFLGANYLVSPNDPSNKQQLNPARNAESIITNGILTIASSGLSFKGFTLDMGDHRAIELQNSTGTNNDFGNFLFEKNIHKINTVGNFNQFPITGKLVTSPALPVTSGFTFTDNRFEKSGSAAGTTLNLNYIKDVSITDNSFVVAGSTFRTQGAVNLGANGIVDRILVSNNLVSDAAIAINGNRIAGVIVTNNKINNSATAFSNTNTMPESSSIEISNNTMGNTTGGSAFVLYNRTGSSNPGTANSLKFENNTMTDVPVPGVPAQLFGSVNFTFNNTVSNTTAIIRGNKINYSGDFSLVQGNNNRPISLRGKIENLTIEKNEISLSNSGGMLPIPGPTFVVNPGITINTEFFGQTMPANAVINILNNKIHGFKQSIAFFDANNSAGNTYTGYGNIPIGATVNINNNSFTGDSISINAGEVGELINANCNWYGTTNPELIATQTTPVVNFSPWLTDGTDSDGATGFQPAAAACNGAYLGITLDAYTDVTCNGLSTGSIDVSITGGTGPFTIEWIQDEDASFSATTSDLANLKAGNYHLNVTDVFGATASLDVTIYEPELLTATADGTSNLCAGATNGTASAIISGGTDPYGFLWSNGATTESITNLAAGNYSFTVTDANGCTAVASYEVTEPELLAVIATGTNVNCFGGANGTAAASVVGGVEPYSYAWHNGSTSAELTGLPAGLYTVIVTDANGCTANGSYQVTEPGLLTALATGTNVNCFGGSNGAAQVTVNGGTLPYTYLWSNGASTPNISTLSEGMFTVTITDAKGCTASSSYTVTEPTLLAATASGTNNLCFGGAAGSADVFPTGGTSPYTYIWSNGATTKLITNLAAGNYTVTITDAKGCTTSAGYNVTQPAILTAVATGTSTACSNSASVIADGGTSPYTYLWSNGANTSAVSNIAAGIYSVTVSDANGCTKSASVTVSGGEAFNPSVAVTNVTCAGGTNGVLTVTNANGQSPFTYSIDGINFQSSNIFSNLPAGNYNLSVVDANGCAGFVSKVITEPPVLNVVINNVQATCGGFATGSIAVTATGGSGGYTYNWASTAYSSTARNISNLVAGTYTLIVTDNKGCIQSITAEVIELAAVTVTSTVTNVTCKGLNNGAISQAVSGGTGPFSYTWNHGPTTKDLVNLIAGNYTVNITDLGSGCVLSKSYSVTQPLTNLALSIAKTNATGCGGGSITATGSGGTAGYQYRLNNSSYQPSSQFIGLLAGNYTVWVRDAKGCTFSQLVSITDNGSDQYESNNSKAQAKAISIGGPINARLAISNDAADWFSFTTPVGAAAYTVNLAHPDVAYTLNLYAAGNNSPALAPTSAGAGYKTYLLAGNTTYYISITGGSLSFKCYTLSVTTPVIVQTLVKENKVVITDQADEPKLATHVFPNPHHGNFSLQISAPAEGKARIELFVGSSRVDLQACKLEYSIVSPK